VTVGVAGVATMVRVPGQFDRADSDITVATPTCCCCCCCCLVALTTTTAFTMAVGICQTREHDESKSRRVVAGLLGFIGAVASISAALSSLAGPPDALWRVLYRLSPRLTSYLYRYTNNVLLRSFIAFVMFVFGVSITQIALVSWASRFEKKPAEQARETITYSVVFAVLFVCELVTIGFFVIGQAASLIVPFLVGQRRSDPHRRKRQPRTLRRPPPSKLT
jgi:hypothetical protein